MFVCLIKASKQSQTSTRIRSKIFKYILIHPFLNKTFKAKSNTKAHTGTIYCLPFLLITHSCSYKAKVFLIAFSHSTKGETV